MKQQVLPFLIIGIGCAVIDFGITYTLTEGADLQRDLAKMIGWVFGTATAYVLNSRYAFKSEVSAVFVLYACTFAVQVLLYKWTEPPLIALGLHNPWKDGISFVIAQGVATVTNFVLQSKVIFKDV